LNDNLKISSLYILICLIWGSTWLAIRIGLESLPPFTSAGFRFLVAAVVIFLLMRYKSISIQTDRTSVILYFTMGFFSFIIPFGLVYWGQQHIASGIASVLFSVYPFFVALFFKWLIPGEKLGLIKLFGILLGFIGIIVIFSDSLSQDLNNDVLGMIAVLASAAMQAYIVVAVKKWGQHLNPLSMNLVPIALAAVVMIPFGLLSEGTSNIKLDFKAVGSVLYLGIFGSVVTFTTYYWLLKRINIIMLALIAFITPIIALILGWLFAGETLEKHQLIGSAIVLLSLLVTNFNNLKTVVKNNRIFGGHQ